ncbi:DNA-damage-inducible protein D [Fibrobacter succinogenes subsp. succinogenes S85]|uniref:DNA-damage-inducible protein D n=1 Tax=Fibrobacter succinogenes (strain ATCC 19169 / S85) TaxID=59374 RepID=C9RQF4_FIBSS|nr:DNA damage-inducible protein D [Fibrobacter succinogenes]ACX74790.1 DNA-damage-inducible protein D [Fibrobacter succinogenes subsp. succinogenes S85]ADL24787.1 DNA-damage-inducible protein D [Fibrobacter succinogenes subsp. succinogenes S85]
MTKKEVTTYSQQTFEKLKHIDENGNEFWYARELQKALEYTEYGKFLPVIEKAIEACRKTGFDEGNHFAHVSEMVRIGSGAERKMDSYKLSRYACYLIVMNGDPRKEVIALGQTYFAVKTRQKEISDEVAQLSEDEKRLAIRDEVTIRNKFLASSAKAAGVETPVDYAVFQNRGYQGLYNGLGMKDIHKRKGLKKNEQILDHMGATELAANLFRITQTDDKLRRENIKGKELANETHFAVGKKVRQTIAELGGTMPENLPTPKISAKKLKQERKKAIAKK